MIHFDPLTTRRLRAPMRELSIGESLTIAAFPDSRLEASTSKLLRTCCTDGLDPLYWTLQERALGVGHYLMAINEEQPDFPLDGGGVFSDYLQAETDIDMATVDGPLLIGSLDGDHWALNHLYGYMLEAIERTLGLVSRPGDSEPMSPFLHWVFGTMAAQLMRVSLDKDGQIRKVLTEVPDAAEAGLYDDWLIETMTVMAGFPDTAFSRLSAMYFIGNQRLFHLFDWGFSQEGRPWFMPKEKKEAEAVLPPATFPPDSCISPAARSLGGKQG